MSPNTSLGERPSVAVSLETIQREIENLKNERRWIVDSYKDKIQAIERERDLELDRNLQVLKRLGVNDTEIPFGSSTGRRQRKYRKLDPDEMKELLSSFMREGEAIPTKEILLRLNISFHDFKAFVRENSDFLEKKGQNKGRVWLLRKNT